MPSPSGVDTVQQVAEFLLSIELFSTLDENTVLVVAGNLEVLELEAGQNLFRRGDVGEHMYIVVSGALRVHDDHTVFNTLHDRDAFGEFALIDSITRTADVTALTDARLLAINGQVFLDLLRDNFDIARAMLRGLIQRVTVEKDRSEKLLQSILPRMVAEEYKATGQVEIRKFDQVSVIFADLAGFTRVSAQMPPERVIADLDHCFSAFDVITDRFSIQKIKTTGDGYMCVGGIPVANRTNAVDAVMAALEMQRFMSAFAEQRRAEGVEFWNCRIGINTGDCFSAVIGKSKLTYDVWSDAVNLASRMESAGEAGRVNIGASTHRLVRDLFDTEPRGLVPVKGRGEVEMFFVNGLRREYTSDPEHLEPNARFYSECARRFGYDG
ncbi:MAG: adenylate/guanylate cyclase domain-containing protein [Pseudomonadota bacterium]